MDHTLKNGPDWLSGALEMALAKIDLLRQARRGLFLHATRAGRYQPCEPTWWTAGFWPGMLWLAYRYTGRAAFAETARPADETLAGCFLDERFFRLHHDVGFQFLPTAVARYLLTEEPAARQRGLLAATFLMSRFNLVGRFIRAWNVPGSERLSIIDTMMNLPLLLWAARETGDDRFSQVALAHADTVLERVIRSDGSVPHIVKIEGSGPVVPWAEGAQGFSPGSVWSRGQSWDIYGFARLYRLTRQPRYLAAARQVAGSYLTRLSGEFIPPWDFCAPPGEPPDTSAAAVAASGLLELAATLGSEEASSYHAPAVATLEALNRDWATWNLPEEDGLLRGGTEHRPVGRNVNTTLIYGDYYFFEALLKLSGIELFPGPLTNPV